MISLKRLEVRPGQRITRDFFSRVWRLLLRAIEERTVRRGRGVHLRHGPDGVIVSADAKAGGGAIIHKWQVHLEEIGDGKWGLRIPEPSYIGGVQATIGGKATSEVDAQTGETPVLTVTVDDFGDDGVCRLYARCSFQKVAWWVESVTLVASATTRKVDPWVFYKLVAELVRDREGTVSVVHHAFFNLSVTAFETRADGYAHYIPGVA